MLSLISVCLIKISSTVFQGRFSGCPLIWGWWILSSYPVVTWEQRQHPLCCGWPVLVSLRMLSTCSFKHRNLSFAQKQQRLWWIISVVTAASSGWMLSSRDHNSNRFLRWRDGARFLVLDIPHKQQGEKTLSPKRGSLPRWDRQGISERNVN